MGRWRTATAPSSATSASPLWPAPPSGSWGLSAGTRLSEEPPAEPSSMPIAGSARRRSVDGRLGGSRLFQIRHQVDGYRDGPTMAFGCRGWRAADSRRRPAGNTKFSAGAIDAVVHVDAPPSTVGLNPAALQARAPPDDRRQEAASQS